MALAPNNFPLAVTDPNAICSGSGHSLSAIKCRLNCSIRNLWGAGVGTWLDAGHSAGTVAKAFLLFAFAVLVGGALPQAFLSLGK